MFPFDFDGSAFDWAVVVRIVLGLAMVGSAIGVIASLVTVAKRATTRSG